MYYQHPDKIWLVCISPELRNNHYNYLCSHQQRIHHRRDRINDQSLLPAFWQNRTGEHKSRIPLARTVATSPRSSQQGRDLKDLEISTSKYANDGDAFLQEVLKEVRILKAWKLSKSEDQRLSLQSTREEQKQTMMMKLKIYLFPPKWRWKEDFWSCNVWLTTAKEKFYYQAMGNWQCPCAV